MRETIGVEEDAGEAWERCGRREENEMIAGPIYIFFH